MESKNHIEYLDFFKNLTFPVFVRQTFLFYSFIAHIFEYLILWGFICIIICSNNHLMTQQVIYNIANVLFLSLL